MNRKELIDALATKTGSSKADADRNIAALIEVITTTLKKGDSVALVGFGTFEVRKRAARNGRNPATGAPQDQSIQGSGIQSGYSAKDCC